MTNEASSKEPWNDLHSAASRPAAGLWVAWVWLVLGTMLVGAGLGVLLLFWVQAGGYQVTLGQPDSTIIRAFSNREIHDLMIKGTLSGGAAGMLVGVALWMRNVREARRRSAGNV